MKPIALLLLLSVLLFGCATPYQPIGGNGGYYHKRLAEDVYSITFSGNGFTSHNRAYDFSLLRACEIGNRLGFVYFALWGQEDHSSSETINLGATSYTTGSAYSTGYGTAFYSGNTSTYQNNTTIYRPKVQLIVKYFQAPPQEKYLELFKIDAVLHHLRSKYYMSSASMASQNSSTALPQSNVSYTPEELLELNQILEARPRKIPAADEKEEMTSFINEL